MWKHFVRAAVIVILTGAPAGAHPHVWIDSATAVFFADGRITSLRHEWTFDVFFSDFVIGQFDVDRSGTLDESEVAQIEANAFSSLKDFGYLTHIRVDGDPVAIADAVDFEAEIRDDVIVYRFRLVLAEAVDPYNQSMTFGLYDETYYIDIGMRDEQPFAVIGAPANACAFRTREDTANPIYGGFVVPLTTDIDCGLS